MVLPFSGNRKSEMTAPLAPTLDPQLLTGLWARLCLQSTVAHTSPLRKFHRKALPGAGRRAKAAELGFGLLFKVLIYTTAL